MLVCLLLVFCTVLEFCVQASPPKWIMNADEITEEWLITTGADTGYTEHIRHFKKIFSSMKVRTFLEFGVGFSTKYFLDHSDKVISVEIVTPGTGPEWFKYCIDLFRNCSTWIPMAYFTGNGLDTSWAPNKYMGTESVYQACAYQPAYYKSYALIDPSFLVDLENFVKQQVADNTIDIAFVDAGVCIRGDLVQVLFHHVPIIAAHDVGPRELRHLNDVYGYGRIRIPENYEEIYVAEGMGTAFWVKKEEKYQAIAKVLKAYAEVMLEVKLKRERLQNLNQNN